MRKFLLENVAVDFDHVFGLFVMSTRSPIFRAAFDAASRVITDSMPVRVRAGVKGPLLVECHDSMNRRGSGAQPHPQAGPGRTRQGAAGQIAPTNSVNAGANALSVGFVAKTHSADL